MLQQPEGAVGLDDQSPCLAADVPYLELTVYTTPYGNIFSRL